MIYETVIFIIMLHRHYFKIRYTIIKLMHQSYNFNLFVTLFLVMPVLNLSNSSTQLCVVGYMYCFVMLTTYA